MEPQTAIIDSLTQAAPFYQWDTPYVVSHEEAEVNMGISFDSLFPLREVEEVECRESMFTHHALEVRNNDLVQRPEGAPDVWLFGLFIGITGLLFLYLRLRKIRLGSLLKALFSQRGIDHMVRESNLKRGRLVPIALLLAAVLAAVVWLQAPMVAEHGIEGWLATGCILATAYLLRNGVCRLLGQVFEGEKTINACITSNYFYHLTLSILLVPLLFLSVYLPAGGEVVRKVMLGIVALCFVIRFIREANLFLTFSHHTSFYLFYYLCTIEIAPAIVLCKQLLLQ